MGVRIFAWGVIIMALCCSLVDPSYGARIKDIASISGVRDNQLIGYGLVVGLAGTGDDMKNGFTGDTLANMLTRQGLTMGGSKQLKAVNTAAVMITAVLPPFAKQGTKLDVIVSSIGQAKSLHGGTLLMTPLRGADGEIYAVAQGPIALGGFLVGGSGGSNVKNHPSAGRITNGALVEREVGFQFNDKTITINLFQPDFSTSSRMASAINDKMLPVKAVQVDSSSVTINFLSNSEMSVFELISMIQSIDVPVDAQAVVVMNEKTGTVVMGENVRISTVAVAHGNLSIEIKETLKVSQPLPFTPTPLPGVAPKATKEGEVIVAPGGQTVVTTTKRATVDEEKRQLMVIPQGVTIQDVVKALNAVGVTPRDLITIIQTIKEAGALQADLRII